MKPQEVGLVLLEQSLADAGDINRPFSDRVSDLAEKRADSVPFDIRVDGDARVSGGSWLRGKRSQGFGRACGHRCGCLPASSARFGTNMLDQPCTVGIAGNPPPAS